MKKIPAAVLGATGMVGQRFIQLLENHPWFYVNEVCGGSTVGEIYEDVMGAGRWLLDTDIPIDAARKVIKSSLDDLESQLVFSAIPARQEGDIETQLARRGHRVFSNTSDHRMDENVPLMIHEVNPDHFESIRYQGTKGYIVTNPNCSTIALVSGIVPIYRAKGIEKMSVTTMQAISGAGHPGIASLDILGNVIPYIGGEEEKIETETLKILGEYCNGRVISADIIISAGCNRVPVIDGHMVDVKISLGENASPEEIREILKTYSSDAKESYHFSPDRLIYLYEELDRPQPRRDAEKDKGMATHIGRIRRCRDGDIRMMILSHNTISGAAGRSIANAEFALQNGYLS